MQNYNILSNDDVLRAMGRKNLPIKIHRDYYKNLKMNLLVPSANQSYSTAIEYISKWFYSKFKEGYFATTFLETSHVLDQFRRIKKHDMISITNPAVVISVDIDHSFNRENIDLYNLGNTIWNNRCSFRDSFFSDLDKHLFIAMQMEMLLLNFNFRIKLSTKGTQIDIARMCQLAFRANGTQKRYLDIDYKVPRELIYQLAEDTGYTIRENCICDVITFLHYVNMRSRLMFFYKFDTSTGHMEFFIKIPNVVVHIRTDQINTDQGETHGMITTDYTVSFDCQVRFPNIKFFAYYSMMTRESIKTYSKLDQKSFLVSISNLSRVPSRDKHGWQWSLQTEYHADEEEIPKIKNKELISIDFSTVIGDLRDVIDYCRSIAISPEVFLNIQVYNSFHLVKRDIDWIHYKINLLEPIESTMSYIIIYMDNEYMNNVISQQRDYEKNRVQWSDNRINSREAHIPDDRSNPIQHNP